MEIQAYTGKTLRPMGGSLGMHIMIAASLQPSELTTLSIMGAPVLVPFLSFLMPFGLASAVLATLAWSSVMTLKHSLWVP